MTPPTQASHFNCDIYFIVSMSISVIFAQMKAKTHSKTRKRFLPGTHTGRSLLQSNALMWCWVFGVMLNENTVGISRAVRVPLSHTVRVEWTGAYMSPMQETHTLLCCTLRGLCCMWLWRDVWFGSQLRAGSWFSHQRLHQPQPVISVLTSGGLYSPTKHCGLLHVCVFVSEHTDVLCPRVNSIHIWNLWQR